MRLATFRTGKVSILYDAESLCDAARAPQIGSSLADNRDRRRRAERLAIGPHCFDPDHWRRAGLVVGEAPGRGASLFLNAGGADGGEQWVLRPYRRGGLAARLSRTRYLWTGLARTRAFRELRLTAELHGRGLPVPRPVAAGVTRHGLTYEAALLTVRIPGARALAELLERGEADDALLAAVGAVLRRFHHAGLDHVDLNARNLLIDAAATPWLIDLDRCRLRAPGAWRAANLSRLERSLAKFGAAGAMAAIRRGYEEASEPEGALGDGE